MGGDWPRRIRRQNSYASGTQEFATQPYLLKNEVQTQPFTFCIIRGGRDSAYAGCAERAASFRIWPCARCQQAALGNARKKSGGEYSPPPVGTAVCRRHPAN